MSTYNIKTIKVNRQATINALHIYGTVDERFNDGTFNFQFYDTQCEEEAIEKLDELKIGYELV